MPVEDSPQNSKVISFEGQQWDEPILYVVRPHKAMLVWRLIKVIFFTIVVAFAWWRLASYLPKLSFLYEILVYLGIFLIALIFLWWTYKYWRRSRAYITDRRVVRFEAVFPITERRSALFWREVAEVKEVSDSIIGRIMKLGELKIFSHITSAGTEIRLPYVYFYEDLNAYLDKIVHWANTSPEKLSTLKPFVTKTREQRYEKELDWKYGKK